MIFDMFEIILWILWVIVVIVGPLVLEHCTVNSIIGWYLCIHPQYLISVIVKMFSVAGLHGIPFDGFSIFIFYALLFIFYCLIALMSYFTERGSIATLVFGSIDILYIIGFVTSYTGACYILFFVILSYLIILLIFFTIRLFTKFWIADDYIYFMLLIVWYIILELFLSYKINCDLRAFLIQVLEPYVIWSQNVMTPFEQYSIRLIFELIALFFGRLWLKILGSRPISFYNAGTEQFHILHYRLPHAAGDKSTNVYLLLFFFVAISLSLIALCWYLGYGAYDPITLVKPRHGSN